MPTGPQGQKRPRDVNACAAMVVKIATGQIEEQYHLSPETPGESRCTGNIRSIKSMSEPPTPGEA